MTDRELLELAAKAAGYERNSAGPIGPCEWNPINDDGDALRLAVKLGIDVCINHEELEVWADDCREPVIRDAGAAARRAIVRAAAAIGRGMP